MKKLLFIASLLIGFTLISNAQSAVMRATIPSSAGGTISGADSVRINGATAGYLYVNPQLIATKCGSFQANSSRKTAAMNGTVTLQASNDGLNYFATAASDTVHVDNGATDVDKIDIAPATGVKYKYYRLKGVNAASTDTSTLRAIWFGRQ